IVFLLGAGNLPVIASVWVASDVVAGTVVLALAFRGLPTGRPAASTAAAAPPRWEMCRFGLKSLLGSISVVQTFRVDQAVVGLFLAPVALGLYVVGLSVTNLPRFVALGVGWVAYPNIAGQADRGAAHRSMW